MTRPNNITGETRNIIAWLQTFDDGEKFVLLRDGDHYVIENSNGYSMRYIDIREAIGEMINELLAIEQGEMWFLETGEAR